MILVPRRVQDDAFMWYGLEVTICNQHFHMSKGRIGTVEHPLTRKGTTISGGVFIPETRFDMGEDITRVDVLHKDSRAYVMFRTSDPCEVYPEEFDLLHSPAWKEDNEWYVAVPQRE